MTHSIAGSDGSSHDHKGAHEFGFTSDVTRRVIGEGGREGGGFTIICVTPLGTLVH